MCPGFLFFGRKKAVFFVQTLEKGVFLSERVIVVCGSDKWSASVYPGRTAARKPC